MSKRHYGRISHFNHVNGWGRITTASRDDIYFDIGDVFYYGKILDSYGVITFKVGAKVSFYISRSATGPRAKDVRLVVPKSNVQAFELLEYLELLEQETQNNVVRLMANRRKGRLSSQVIRN